MRFKLFKNKKKSQKQQEKSRGRSMVEMLGVLAIIGVLSIGGIQGYTIAMRKHRANEILNTMQKYATVLYSSCQSGLLNKKDEINERGGVNGDKNMLLCDNLIDFDKAGLGGLPSGVVAVTSHGYPVSYNPDFFPTIIRSNSGDMVRFFIHLNSKELCESVLSVAGTVSASEGQTLGLCDNSKGYLENVNRNAPNTIPSSVLGTDTFQALVTFMMN